MITLHGNGTIEGIDNSNFNSSLPAGHVIQVQSGIENSQEQKLADQFTSGPEVTITATSASNKILIMGTKMAERMKKGFNLLDFM